VALVDDVVTTGSTLYELREVLLAEGVARVDLWACTRAGQTAGA
jgi:predicted amidophosphoribosyltransferase